MAICSPFCSAASSICRTAVSMRSANGGSAGQMPVSSSAFARSNSHGSPSEPRPIITPSAPVCARMRTASSGSATSPLANTGMETACLTSRIASQSAVPLYCCERVRPCSVIAAAPDCSAILANSTQLTLFSSQPLRNLTVTGTSTAFTTAAITLDASSGSFISAEPSPLFTIFGAGQPMLMSMISQPDFSSASFAPSAIVSGSCPKIWAAAGCSSAPSSSRRGVFLS